MTLSELRPGRGWQATRYPDLAARGERQLWLFTRAQLRELGWTSQQISHELRMRRWSHPAPNVLAAQNSGLTHGQLLWLGVLHAGPTSALSHLTACLAAGLRWTGEPTVHVLTQKGDLVAPLRGFRFHQTRRRYQDWVRPPGVLPPTLGVRHALLLTAERERNVRRAAGLLAAGVQQGLVTVDELSLGISQIRKLRHGSFFRLVLGDIAGGSQSFAEINLMQLCRGAGLAMPTRQVRRTDKSGRWRYLDAEWILPDGRVLVLEVDGSFHMKTEHWWADQRRERSVVLSGRTVLRCSSVELRLAPDDVLNDLRAAGVPLLTDSSVVA